MATFISLLGFTDQGIRKVKQTTKRADAFKAMARKTGVTVKDIYWTVGAYDVVIVMEAPDDESATTALLSLGALGNVRTQTLRAFSASEMNRIIGKMA
ncbi:MAG: GYD domain-containing protein [Candidatus Methylomirabilales bacterium]